MKQTFWMRISYYLLFIKSLCKVNWGLLVGMWQLTRLPQPAITFFGGSKLPPSNPYAQQIRLLSHRLADRGFSIITGGGLGLMEAANLGAYQSLLEEHGEYPAHQVGMQRDRRRRIVTLGIGVQHLPGHNQYIQEFIVLPYFFIRKWLLVRYSVGFVLGPGGFGTLDELFEVLTLMQTNQMPQMPIVLLGTNYWEPFVKWVYDRALASGLITESDAHLFTVTDDIDEAYSILLRYCSEDSKCALEFKPPTHKS